MNDTTAIDSRPTSDDPVPWRERLLAAIGGTLTALVRARRHATPAAAPAKRKWDPATDGVDQRRTVLVRKPAHELYHLLRDLEHLPRFLDHLADVVREDDRTWQFLVRDGEQALRWRVRLSDDVPGNCLAWESLPGGDLIAGGTLTLRDAARGMGTIVDIELWYRPVEHRRANDAAVHLFERFTGRRLAANLLALRELIETDRFRPVETPATRPTTGAPIPAVHARPMPDLTWPPANDLGPGPRG